MGGSNLALARAEKYIDENAVMVFSKSYCPYCRATKSLLTQKGVAFGSIELDEDSKFLTHPKRSKGRANNNFSR